MVKYTLAWLSHSRTSDYCAFLMQSSPQDQIPSPPGIVDALIAGFDTVANHLELVLFPLVLDVWLWLGPHLRIHTLVVAVLQDIAALQPPGSENADLYQTALDVWRELSTRINLFAVLRTFPIGIPSLMTGRMPLNTPLGSASLVDLPSWGMVVALWGIFLVIGIVLGTLYFLLTARAATQQEASPPLLKDWVYASGQIFLLAVLWMLSLLFVVTPLSVVAAVMGAMGALGQIALFITIGIALWMLLPLLFAAHGVFVHRLFLLRSILYGVRVARFTMPSTSLFFLSLFVLSRGLDLLWSVPAETSWLTLVGIAGHAFIATALLAASFIYYQRAGDWVQQMLDRVQATRVA
ncbi:MAG: hypothetical protein D6755_12410 [Anaerolineae bacterium]|nr:MAG: hypothetical protein D6755_12410 [Anaerolineae bacterium]